MQNSIIFIKLFVNTSKPKENKHTYLLFYVIISMGLGLNLILISAWKSGRNPSAISDTTKNAIPIVYVVLSSPCLAYGSVSLNIINTTVINTATMIFLFYNFRLFYYTREQHTPTKTTDKRLQDLNSVAIGKLA